MKNYTMPLIILIGGLFYYFYKKKQESKRSDLHSSITSLNSLKDFSPEIAAEHG